MLKRGIDSYKQAIRIKPDYVKAHIDLGRAYIELGQLNEAVGALRQAVRIDPDHGEAHYHLGLAYLGLGDIASAYAEYEVLINIDKELAVKLLTIIYQYYQQSR